MEDTPKYGVFLRTVDERTKKSTIKAYNKRYDTEKEARTACMEYAEKTIKKAHERFGCLKGRWLPDENGTLGRIHIKTHKGIPVCIEYGIFREKSNS